MEVKLRVGVIVTGSEALKSERGSNIYHDMISKTEKLGVEVVGFDKPLSQGAGVSKQASLFFSKNNVDLLLVIEGTWTYDNLLIDVTRFLDCPVIFWATPETFNVPFPQTCTLVGITQTCGTLVKIGKKIKIILDDIYSEEGFNKFKDYVNVLSGIKKLQFSKIGVIGGSRCPGMLDTSFHELELRNQVGPEVVFVPSSDLIKEINTVSDSEAAKAEKEMIPQDQVENVEQEIMLQSMKVYIATKKIVHEYGLDAATYKCWPDLRNVNICSPCFTLSKLSDEGIPLACEGDAMGAVSMYILQLLTGKNVYLGDFLKADKKTNIAQYFHCGAASSNLAEEKGKILYRKNAQYSDYDWINGLIVDFPLKPGRVTFARVGEIKAKYGIVTYTGEAVETDMFVRGNPAKVKLDHDSEDVVNGLIQNGAGHHQIAVHGDVLDKIELLCEFSKLDLTML
jgi:L-fucose isomerase-like protein